MFFRLDLHTPLKLKYIWWKDFVFRTWKLFFSNAVPIISTTCFTLNIPIWCGVNENITSWKIKVVMRHMSRKAKRKVLCNSLFESLLSTLTSKISVQNWPFGICQLPHINQQYMEIKNWYTSEHHKVAVSHFRGKLFSLVAWVTGLWTDSMFDINLAKFLPLKEILSY